MCSGSSKAKIDDIQLNSGLCVRALGRDRLKKKKRNYMSDTLVWSVADPCSPLCNVWETAAGKHSVTENIFIPVLPECRNCMLLSPFKLGLACHLPRNNFRTNYSSGVLNPCVSSAPVTMVLAMGLCSASALSVLASVIEIIFFQCSIRTALSLHSACSYDHWGLLLFISVRQPFLKFKQTEMFGIVKKIRD